MNLFQYSPILKKVLGFAEKVNCLAESLNRSARD